MEQVITDYVEEMKQALARLDSGHVGQITAAARLIIDCYRRGGAVYVCGNGGSAADAQHIAAELAGRFLRERRALACAALTTNTSILTAVGNDYSYDVVFSRQVEAYVREGDVLWGISTSGNSRNVLEAMTSARTLGAKVLGFTGGSGGAMPTRCDVCFVAPAGATYCIQQLHQLAYHAICDLVERDLAETGKPNH